MRRPCLERQGGVPVVQHGHRTGLGGIPLLAEVGAADGRGRRVLVDVGVVEQPEPELHREQAARRLVDARLGDPALGHEVEQDLDALLAAELVGAGLEDQLHAAVRVEVLDAPGASGQHLVADVVVVDELPVGDDDAVVAELAAQQARDDLLVVAEADRLDGLAVDDEVDRHPVVGHDPRRAGLDDRREGLEVVGESPSGIDLLAPVGEVRVLAVLLRAAAGEVLARAGHAVPAERISLGSLGDTRLRAP